MPTRLPLWREFPNTERLLSPFDERELLKSGYGITNVVSRTTATADLLTKDEVIAGGQRLAKKILRYRPRVLAVLGVGAYRVASAYGSARDHRPHPGVDRAARRHRRRDRSRWRRTRA